MSKSSQSKPVDQSIEVRYTFPKRVHEKIKAFKRIMSAKSNNDIGMEEALIQMIDDFQLPKI